MAITYKGLAATFRTIGNASTVQTIFTLANGTDAANVVTVRKLIVRLDATAALNEVMPQVRIGRHVTSPAGGIVLNKGSFDTALTSDSNIVLRGAAVSDGSALTPIAVTSSEEDFYLLLEDGTSLLLEDESFLILNSPARVTWQQYTIRLHTLEGQVLSRDNEILPSSVEDTPIVIRSGQALVVQVISGIGTSNPATNHWFVECVWDEELPPPGPPGGVSAAISGFINISGTFEGIQTLDLISGEIRFSGELGGLTGGVGSILGSIPIHGLIYGDPSLYGTITGSYGLAGNISGLVGSSGQILGYINLSGEKWHGFTDLIGALSGNIPISGRLQAFLELLTFILKGAVTNASHFGVTEYEDFGFNSFACINGVYVAASEDGLFSLGGKLRDGEPIQSEIDGGIIDFHKPYKRKPRQVWITKRVDDANIVTAAAIVNGGSSYAVNNILTVVGGTGTAATLKVTTVSTGVITGITINAVGAYTVNPTNPVLVTGGAGSGATFNLTLKDPLVLIVKGDEDDVHEYPIVIIDSKIHEERVKIARGLRNRFYQFGIKNVDGADFEIDSIRIMVDGIPAKKR